MENRKVKKAQHAVAADWPMLRWKRVKLRLYNLG
jgi:hypothetical protein